MDYYDFNVRDTLLYAVCRTKVFCYQISLFYFIQANYNINYTSLTIFKII